MDYKNAALALTKIGTALSTEKHLNKLYHLIVDEIIAFANCDGCSLFIRYDQPACLISQATRTLSLEKSGKQKEFAAFSVPLNQNSIVGYTVFTGEAVNIPDCYAIPTGVTYKHDKSCDAQRGYRTTSLLSVPIRDQDDSIMGAIQLVNKLDKEGKIIPFSEELLLMITAIASQVAIAMKNVRLQNIQNESSFVFNSLLLAFCAYSFFLAILQKYQSYHLSNNLMPTLITAGFSVLLFIIGILVIWKTKLPLSYYGLSRHNLQKSLWESGLVTLAIIAVLTLLKIGGIRCYPALLGPTIVDWSLWDISYYTYLLICPLQEFISRGVLQSSLERSLRPGRIQPFLAIVISSCVFGFFHLVYSLGLALLTVISGFIWGYLFTRHKNILGISLSHFLVGNYIGLLGFWDLLLTF